MENQSNMSSMPLAVGVGPHESLASRPTTPLPPALPPRPDKRCLVLVYIHGFKGNETSFRDFPTDVHESLVPKLGKYTVHTHIYPKYKTKRQFSVATVNFCEWLRNTLRSYHKPLNTIDVILIGHSMGGSLASEAIILLSRITFGHNIIGIIGIDVPFLGIHPHVVTSGVVGLVKPRPKSLVVQELGARPTAEAEVLSTSESSFIYGGETFASKVSMDEGSQSTSASSSQVSLVEPIFIPARTPSPTRPPRTPSPQPPRAPSPSPKKSLKESLSKTVQTIYKNRHDLGTAGPRYIWSHVEYGHILLDPEELKAQYDQLRALSIHFVNFYTSIPYSKGGGEWGRVFCTLPSSVARAMDGWEFVEMPEGMDEPTAHSAIFVKDWFLGYEGFVHETVEKSEAAVLRGHFRNLRAAISSRSGPLPINVPPMLFLDGGSTSIALFLPTAKPDVPSNLSKLWTSAYSLLYPSAVKQWHLSFLDAGSDIITTNTYQIPLAEEIPDVTLPTAVRAAVQLAIEATEEAGHGAVALSFGTKNSNYGKGEYAVEPLATVAEYTWYHRAKLLQFHAASEGFWDKILYFAFETVSSFEEAEAILSVLTEKEMAPIIRGKKVWITFSCGDASVSRLRHIVSQVVKSPDIPALWGLGINCVGIDIAIDLARMVEEEIGSSPLTLMVYPDAGKWKDRTTAQFTYDAPTPTNGDVDRWVGVMAQLSRMNAGKVVLGGCCNTDSRFIQKLRGEFK